MVHELWRGGVGGGLNATFEFSNALRRARGIVSPNIAAYVDRCFLALNGSAHFIFLLSRVV